MNLNPLATAALVMIGIVQVWQAWTALQPSQLNAALAAIGTLQGEKRR